MFKKGEIMKKDMVEFTDDEVNLLSVYTYAGYVGKLHGIPIEVGLKIEVRDTIYNELKNNKYIRDNFKLNVRRLNRWWYSIYFDIKS